MKHISLSLALVLLIAAITLSGCGQPATTGNTQTAAGATTAAQQTPQENKASLKLRCGGYEADGTSVDAAIDEWAEAVRGATEGRIDISNYPASQLGTLQEMQEAVRLGTLDMCQTDPSMMTNLQREWGILSLPFLMRDYDHFQAFIKSDLLKEMNEFTAKENNLINIGWFYKGFRCFCTNRDISTADARYGLKLRSPEAQIYIDTFTRLGFSPTPISWSDTYTSFQTGIVDGCDTVPESIVNLEFWTVGKYITRANHMLSLNSLSINSGIWAKIHPDDQAVMIKLADEIFGKQCSSQLAKDLDYYKTMSDAGAIIVDLDEASLKEIKEVFQEYWHEYVKDMPRGAGIVETINNM